MAPCRNGENLGEKSNASRCYPLADTTAEIVVI